MVALQRSRRGAAVAGQRCYRDGAAPSTSLARLELLAPLTLLLHPRPRPPGQAFLSFRRVVENANVIMATYADEALGDTQVRMQPAPGWWRTAGPVHAVHGCAAHGCACCLHAL